MQDLTIGDIIQDVNGLQFMTTGLVHGEVALRDGFVITTGTTWIVAASEMSVKKHVKSTEVQVRLMSSLRHTIIATMQDGHIGEGVDMSDELEILPEVVDGEIMSDEIEPTTPETLAAYMRRATSQADWSKRIDHVKEVNGGDYPDFWWPTIIKSGLMEEVMGPGSSQIKIYGIRMP